MMIKLTFDDDQDAGRHPLRSAAPGPLLTQSDRFDTHTSTVCLAKALPDVTLVGLEPAQIWGHHHLSSDCKCTLRLCPHRHDVRHSIIVLY
jgi:hypothetical protein